MFESDYIFDYSIQGLQYASSNTFEEFCVDSKPVKRECSRNTLLDKEFVNMQNLVYQQQYLLDIEKQRKMGVLLNSKYHVVVNIDVESTDYITELELIIGGSVVCNYKPKNPSKKVMWKHPIGGIMMCSLAYNNVRVRATNCLISKVTTENANLTDDCREKINKKSNSSTDSTFFVKVSPEKYMRYVSGMGVLQPDLPPNFHYVSGVGIVQKEQTRTYKRRRNSEKKFVDETQVILDETQVILDETQVILDETQRKCRGNAANI
jgi:hypothetical protein